MWSIFLQWVLCLKKRKKYTFIIHSNVLVSLQNLLQTCSMPSIYIFFRCFLVLTTVFFLDYFVSCLASYMTIMQSKGFRKVSFLFLTIVDTSWRRETDWSVYSFFGAGPHSWYKSHQGHGWVWTNIISVQIFVSLMFTYYAFPSETFFSLW